MSVAINSLATGVPFVGAQLLSQSAIPVILAASGSIANNGAMSLTSGNGATFPSAWVTLPANAISSSSAAGTYFCQFSSSAFGTLFNNVLGNQTPFIPATTSAFITSGPGAFTGQGVGAADAYLFGISLPAGTLGPNGALRLRAAYSDPATSNNNSGSIYLGIASNGATKLKGVPFGVSAYAGLDFYMRNRGLQNSQVISNAALGFDQTTGGGVQYLAIDTSAATFVGFAAYSNSSSNGNVVLEGYTIEYIQQ